VVRDFLFANFGEGYMPLAADRIPGLIAELANLGIAGGAVYDALIAATARGAGGTLLMCDRGARLTYERLGVAIEYLGAP
jgi:hypothetical protein